MKASRVFAHAAVVTALLSAGTSDAQTSDELLARQKRIAEMSAAEKQQLLVKQQQLAALSADEQQRLRLLEEQLQQDPEAAKLRRVMNRYNEMLNVLRPEQRAELAEKPPDERVAFLKQIQIEPAHNANDRYRIPPDDAKKIVRFMEDRIWSKRDELLKEAPQFQRKHIEQMTDENQKRTRLLGVALAPRHANAQILLSTDGSSLQELGSQLSPATRQYLAAKSPEERQQIVRQLLRDTFAERVSELGSRAVQRDELERFFEHDLTAGEKKRLASLSPEERQWELRRLFWQRQFGGVPAGTDRRPRGLKPGPGRRPPANAGPGNPPDG